MRLRTVSGNCRERRGSGILILITRRSQVQILAPLPIKSRGCGFRSPFFCDKFAKCAHFVPKLRICLFFGHASSVRGERVPGFTRNRDYRRTFGFFGHTWTEPCLLHSLRKPHPILAHPVPDEFPVMLEHHLQRAVPQHSCDPERIFAVAKHQGGEGVARLVHRALPELRSLQRRVPDLVAQVVDAQRVAVKIPEYVYGIVGADQPVLRQDVVERVEHVDVPVGGERLGRPLDPLHAPLADRDRLHHEIHVVPFKRQELVGAHPREKRHREIGDVVGIDRVQEQLHLREGEGVDQRLLLLEPPDQLARALPEILPAPGVVEEVLHRHHDVVLPLGGERTHFVEELLDVPPPDEAERHPPEVRDGVDLHDRLVVPPRRLRHGHLLPPQPFHCVLGEGDPLRLEDPQVLPPGGLELQVLLHHYRDGLGGAHRSADPLSLPVAHIDEPVLSSFPYAHDRPPEPRGHALGSV